MNTLSKNIRTIYIISSVFLMFILVFVFLLLHKYAYNYEKSKTIQETTIKLQRTVTEYIADFIKKNNISDSLPSSQVQIVQFNDLIPLIEEKISKPLGITNTTISIIDSKDSTIILTNNLKREKESLNSPISSQFFIQTPSGINTYICYYEIPDFKYLIMSNLKFAMALTVILILILLIIFVFLIQRWLNGIREVKLKDEFFQNITHELKTPIATTSIATDIFNKYNYDLPVEKTKNYINIIVEENRKMKQIVDKLLSISVIENGKSKMINTEVDIHKLLDSTLKNFQFVVNEKGGQIEKNFNATSFVVNGDSSFIVMIFNNLIDNAIKYSLNEPKISITTSSDVHGISIQFVDNGIGISNEDLGKIFLKTYRVKNNHSVKGFGLGLYFVKQLIDIHHGKITAKSTLGKGTEFTVFLPYRNKSNNN